ncbi:unnamed protein product [Vitrella brassicaformis CCMP3155]|uniref:Uncharacterized protein n=2 Tax=Vitrella brassicaformis TaxID=1169539 RepID=A0A0G4G6V3_VITBC|nr:unnamed protein product [Vitrella brassicaformis CCMP3155]|eukprot:CEM24099.1 unnamed protein product [Vitrella brassicaformis CCMP3155]
MAAAKEREDVEVRVDIVPDGGGVEEGAGGIDDEDALRSLFEASNGVYWAAQEDDASLLLPIMVVKYDTPSSFSGLRPPDSSEMEKGAFGYGIYSFHQEKYEDPRFFRLSSCRDFAEGYDALSGQYVQSPKLASSQSERQALLCEVQARRQGVVISRGVSPPAEQEGDGERAEGGGDDDDPMDVDLGGGQDGDDPGDEDFEADDDEDDDLEEREEDDVERRKSDRLQKKREQQRIADSESNMQSAGKSQASGRYRLRSQRPAPAPDHDSLDSRKPPTKRKNPSRAARKGGRRNMRRGTDPDDDEAWEADGDEDEEDGADEGAYVGRSRGGRSRGAKPKKEDDDNEFEVQDILSCKRQADGSYRWEVQWVNGDVTFERRENMCHPNLKRQCDKLRDDLRRREADEAKGHPAASCDPQDFKVVEGFSIKAWRLPGGAQEITEGVRPEYLLLQKGRSYREVEWVGEEDLLKWSTTNNPQSSAYAKAHLTAWKKKDIPFGLDPQQETEMELFRQIDTIICCRRSLHDPDSKEYFVKWRHLSVSNATWEDLSALTSPEDQEAIDRFEFHNDHRRAGSFEQFLERRGISRSDYDRLTQCNTQAIRQRLAELQEAINNPQPTEGAAAAAAASGAAMDIDDPPVDGEQGTDGSGGAGPAAAAAAAAAAGVDGGEGSSSSGNGGGGDGEKELTAEEEEASKLQDIETILTSDDKEKASAYWTGCKRLILPDGTYLPSLYDWRSQGLLDPSSATDGEDDRVSARHKRLFPHQLEGIQLILYNASSGRGTILGDEMGLGKTAQSIVALEQILHAARQPPSRGRGNAAAARKLRAAHALVVVPLATLENWRREFDMWAPHLMVLSLRDNREDRRVLHEVAMQWVEPNTGEAIDVSQREEKGGKVMKPDVILTTYETLAMKDVKPYLRHPLYAETQIPFAITVLDEVQKVKQGRGSQRFDVMYGNIETDLTLCLTGTPIQNEVKEVYPLLALCDPSRFIYGKASHEPFGSHMKDDTSQPPPASAAAAASGEGDSQADNETPAEETQTQQRESAGGDEGEGDGGGGAGGGGGKWPEWLSGETPKERQERLRQAEQQDAVVQQMIDSNARWTHDEFEAHFGGRREESAAKQLSLYPHRSKQIMQILQPYLLRREKGDVLKKLKPKQVKFVQLEPTPLQTKIEGAIFLGHGPFKDKSMRRMFLLRYNCNHPLLLTDQNPRKQGKREIKEKWLYESHEDCKRRPGEKYEDHRLRLLDTCSTKFVFLAKLFPKLIAENRKILVFTEFLNTCDLLEEWFLRHEWPYERLDGSVTDDRQLRIDRFNVFHGFCIFLSTTRAGGQGINLTSATCVVHFDPQFNPQQDMQAQARCHRIGQKNTVEVFTLCMKGGANMPSFEERIIYKMQSRKLGLEKVIMEGDEAGFTAQEQQKLLDEGLYALMHEKKQEQEAQEERLKQFHQASIEDIIVNSSKTITLREKKTGGQTYFSTAHFMPNPAGGDRGVRENMPDEVRDLLLRRGGAKKDQAWKNRAAQVLGLRPEEAPKSLKRQDRRARLAKSRLEREEAERVRLSGGSRPSKPMTDDEQEDKSDDDDNYREDETDEDDDDDDEDSEGEGKLRPRKKRAKMAAAAAASVAGAGGAAVDLTGDLDRQTIIRVLCRFLNFVKLVLPSEPGLQAKQEDTEGGRLRLCGFPDSSDICNLGANKEDQLEALVIQCSRDADQQFHAEMQTPLGQHTQGRSLFVQLIRNAFPGCLRFTLPDDGEPVAPRYAGGASVMEKLAVLLSEVADPDDERKRTPNQLRLLTVDPLALNRPFGGRRTDTLQMLLVKFLVYHWNLHRRRSATSDVRWESCMEDQSAAWGKILKVVKEFYRMTRYGRIMSKAQDIKALYFNWVDWRFDHSSDFSLAELSTIKRVLPDKDYLRDCRSEQVHKVAKDIIHHFPGRTLRHVADQLGTLRSQLRREQINRELEAGRPPDDHRQPQAYDREAEREAERLRCLAQLKQQAGQHQLPKLAPPAPPPAPPPAAAAAAAAAVSGGVAPSIVAGGPAGRSDGRAAHLCRKLQTKIEQFLKKV